LANRLPFKKLGAAAEDLEEAGALRLNPVERPQLVENDSPRDDREDHQHDQNELRNRRRVFDEGEKATPERSSWGSGAFDLHSEQVSERAQTSLRAIMRRWDSAESSEYHVPKRLS